MAIEYKVCEMRSDRAKFEREVTDLLNSGWLLAGSCSATVLHGEWYYMVGMTLTVPDPPRGDEHGS